MLPRPPHTGDVGAAAETRAARHLRREGLTILARNLRCKAGELDLVCLDGDTLVIVEVRLRARDDFGGALASVTAAKRQKIIRAAQFHWQRRREWRDRMMRFDVVAVAIRADGTHAIEWIRDAFRLTG